MNQGMKRGHGRVLLAAVFAMMAIGMGGVARAADKVVVATIATTGGGNAVFVGKDKGFFADEGIDLSVLKVPAATSMPPAVASGDADVGIGSLSAGFFNVAGNGDFVLVAGTTYAKPGFSQAIIMASTDAYNKGFKGAADLPGKKVAFSSLGGFAHFMLYLISEKYKFPFSAVQTPALGSDANALAAVKSGSVDAAMVGSAVLAVPLEKAGEGKIIVHTADETSALSNVMFTSPKDMTNRHDVLVRFMRAYLRSAAYYADAFSQRDASGALVRTPKADEVLNILSANIGQPVDAIVPALTYVLPDGALDPEEVKKQLTVWQKLNLSDAKIDSDKLVDQSLLRDAKAAKTP